MFASHSRLLGETEIGPLPEALGEPSLFNQHLDWNISTGHLASDLGKNVSIVSDHQIVA